MPDPTPHALIVAHGQPSAPAPPEAALADLARAVSDRLPGWAVHSATLATPGRIEDEAAKLPAGAVIYPFFMANGYFVTRVLPKRLAELPCRITPPLGLDPDLPALAASFLNLEADATGPVLLAAHGSGRGTAAAEAAEGFADALRPLLPGRDIVTGYVEQAPSIADAARGLGPGAVCLPFFAQEGDHCREDIPEALDEAGFAGTCLPPLGHAAGIPALIARALRQFVT